TAGARNALDVIQALRRVYTGSTGYDIEHIQVPEEREWLQEAAESGRFHTPLETAEEIELLAWLTEVETFEHFLLRFFPGKTRFSIEGLDMMVPMLDQVIREADEAEIRFALLGMAHRGRLNVL